MAARRGAAERDFVESKSHDRSFGSHRSRPRFQLGARERRTQRRADGIRDTRVRGPQARVELGPCGVGQLRRRALRRRGA